MEVLMSINKFVLLALTLSTATGFSAPAYNTKAVMSAANSADKAVADLPCHQQKSGSLTDSTNGKRPAQVAFKPEAKTGKLAR